MTELIIKNCPEPCEAGSLRLSSVACYFRTWSLKLKVVSRPMDRGFEYLASVEDLMVCKMLLMDSFSQ